MQGIFIKRVSKMFMSEAVLLLLNFCSVARLGL